MLMIDTDNTEVYSCNLQYKFNARLLTNNNLFTYYPFSLPEPSSLML